METIIRSGPDPLDAMAVDADRHLLGPDQGAWLDRLDRDRDALDARLDRLIAAGDCEAALRLAAALARFWWMRGHTAVGRGRMDRVLAIPGGSPAARAVAQVGAGGLAYAAGDFPGARRHYDQAIPLLRAAGLGPDLARALDGAGLAARQLLDLASARALHAEALGLLRQTGGAPAEVALCLNNLGVVAFFRGDPDAARAYHREALALREAAGDVRGTASSLNNQGQAPPPGGGGGVPGGRRSVGACECLELAAELAHAEGLPANAVRFLSAATDRRERLPAPRPPVFEGAVTALLAAVRGALGAAAFEAAWRDGREPGEAVEDRLA